MADKTQSSRVKTLRDALRAKYGARHYRITGHIGINEEVHIYGPMPNATHIVGWWLMGDMLQAEMWLDLA